MFAHTRSAQGSSSALRSTGQAARLRGTAIRRGSRGSSSGSGGAVHGCACGGGCPRCQARSPQGQAQPLTRAAHAAASGWHPQEQGGGGATETKGGSGTSRKELFCHKCQQAKTLKVSVYSQWSSDFRESNISFAEIFMANHNVKVDIDKAGVIPAMYDEEQQKYGKVESVADLCDIVKALETQGVLPGAGIPAFFLPFGQQLKGAAADTVGWHIPDINVNCQDHVGKLKTTKALLIDSNPEVKSCSKVLLHEIGHAVGNGDQSGSGLIMGPCDPGAPQQPPIGCDPERTHNLMTAGEVKKFCAGA